MPKSIIFFISFLIITMIIFASIAFKYDSGLVTEHAYEKGLSFSQMNKEGISSKPYPFKISINYDGTHVYAQLVGISIIDIQKIEAKAIRPAGKQNNEDFEIILNSAGETFVKSVPISLSKGLWEIRIKITAHGASHYFSQRILVQQ